MTNKNANKKKGKDNHDTNYMTDADINSVVTVYQNAVPCKNNSKQDSSSSEEIMDTSNETDMGGKEYNKIQQVSQFLVENSGVGGVIPGSSNPQPGCSYHQGNMMQ